MLKDKVFVLFCFLIMSLIKLTNHFEEKYSLPRDNVTYMEKEGTTEV